MLNIIKKIFTTGVVTEPVKFPTDNELEQLGITLKQRIDKKI